MFQILKSFQESIERPSGPAGERVGCNKDDKAQDAISIAGVILALLSTLDTCDSVIHLDTLILD